MKKGFTEMVGGFFIPDENQTLLQMFGLLKLVWILRLGRLITYLNLRQDFKLSLKFVRLIFFLILYLHLTGCVWFFIARQDEQWLDPGIYAESSLTQYLLSLYNALLMLAGNDIGPIGNF